MVSVPAAMAAMAAFGQAASWLPGRLDCTLPRIAMEPPAAPDQAAAEQYAVTGPTRR